MHLARITPDRAAVDATPPRRIALFTGNYVDVRDGVALTLNRLVRWLLERGDDVRVICPEPSADRFMEPSGRVIGVPAVSWFLQPEYRAAVPLRFRRALERFDPQVVHLATPDFLGMFGLRWARRRGIPAVASFHSNIMSYLQYNGPQQILARSGWRQLAKFYDRCDQVFVPSESMASELAARGVGETYRLWERGIDTDRFDPSFRSENFRRKWGLDPELPVIAFVARLRWEKGLRTLVSALHQLGEDAPAHQVLVVGEGVGQSWMREQLPSAIFTGALVGEALSEAYASSDLFFYPSTTDTFGNVTLEAMASGLATVCADAPGSKDLVADGETGLLCRPDDPESFAAGLRSLLADPDLRARMGRAAHVRSQMFSWDVNMARVSAYYDEVLGERAARVS